MGALGPAVASDATNFMVVWADGRSVTCRDFYWVSLSRAGASLVGLC